MITLPLVILIIARNKLAFRLSKLNAYHKSNLQFVKSPYFKYMICEILIHLVISCPGYESKICYMVMDRDVCNPLSDLFMLIAILRLYLVIRVFVAFSKWSNNHSREIRDLY